MASRSSLQRWLRTQSRATQAEHELLLSAAKCIRGGGEQPTAAAIANAKRLRAKASAEFPLAMAELRTMRRALDERLAKQELSLARAIRSAQYFVGMEKTYQLAVLALIETHPAKDRLGQALERFFAEREGAGAELETGDLRQGAADAQDLIHLARAVDEGPSA